VTQPSSAVCLEQQESLVYEDLYQGTTLVVPQVWKKRPFLAALSLSKGMRASRKAGGAPE